MIKDLPHDYINDLQSNTETNKLEFDSAAIAKMCTSIHDASKV